MRTQLKYEGKDGFFRAEKVLPVGFVFPLDFGFLPSTLGGDGDPLDALVLSEARIP
jgi:inorganic pyrophosphatase